MDHNAIADVLDGAADVIERDGWWNGRTHESPRAQCASNAMQAFASAENINTDDFLAAHVVLADSLGLGQSLGSKAAEHIFDWNDGPERTKQEVLDALRLAAKQERIAADAEQVSA